jgi:DHA2 family multidrug resistance protein
MLMGSMFLLPVFMRRCCTPATLSGMQLLPRTLAMMVASPIVGRLYNKMPPAWIVAAGVVLFAFGSWQLSHITLDSSTATMIAPLAITGVAFACLFVPPATAITTARHQLADLPNRSFFRQISGSVGVGVRRVRATAANAPACRGSVGAATSCPIRRRCHLARGSGSGR